MRSNAQPLSCVAETGGGNYFDAGSEAELIEAMNEAVKVEPGEAKPVEHTRGYALIIRGKDETGRSFRMTGTHALGNKDLGGITSNGRYGVDDPGDYTIEAGPLLQDGTAYKPIKKQVSVTETGDTIVDFKVTRPAIVSANFSEDGEDRKGSHVTVYQEGKEVFGFRAFDEALARPGVYEFRAKPNKDNELSVENTLTEGEHTIVDFNLIKTVQFHVKYILSNGETAQRTGQLYKNSKWAYDVYSGNFTTAKPGTYELREKGTKYGLNPFTPTEITITEEDKQTIEVPVTAGYITIAYDGNKRDFNSKANRAFVHPIDPDTGNLKSSTYVSTGRVTPASPGKYRAIAASSIGYFDPVDFSVEHDTPVTVTLTAKPTAHISVTYTPAEYARKPDRAFLVPLDGQKPIKTYMSPGKVS